LIRLNIAGVLTVDGVISADGTRGPDYKCSGGSGGSVNISASGLTGAGVIKVGGGYGLYNGGGGGGRIAITAPANAFTGTVTAYGSGSSYDRPGGPGSVLINGTLTFDNDGISGHTDIPGANYSAAEISKIIIRAGSLAAFPAEAVFEGALEITAATVAVNDTLTMGAVIVNSGGVIAPKQHKIDLIVESSMTVTAGGMVLADGMGYLAGSGPGRGPDGASGGGGSYGGIGGGSTGPVYGSLINPMDFGSGGGYQINGSSSPGGAGGGLVRLSVSGALTVDGIISANGDSGADYYRSGGSGGTINITAVELNGIGAITANGGYGHNYNSAGGGGRVAVSSQYVLFQGTISAYGGGSFRAYPGGPGSVLINGALTFDNDGISGHTDIPGVNYSAAEISKIIVKSGSRVNFAAGAVFEAGLEITAATVAVNDTLTIGPVIVNSGGVIAPEQHKIDLIVKSSMTVTGGGMVLADGMGYPPGNGPGRGNDGPYGGGGSYGGQGGGSDLPPYGSLINPVDFGSGGGYQISGSSDPGGAGGGFVRLSVSGDLTVDGAVSANGSAGPNYYGGGGSGGGINIASGRLIGSGKVKADGGSSFSSNGSGGGGRIVVYYGQKIFTGAMTAVGGGIAWGLHGDNGSIVDNGAIISGGTLGPGESIAAPSQTIGSARSLTEDLSEENMVFNNLAASGTFSGAVSFPQLAIVRINSGAYAGKGFAKGTVSAMLNGKPYLGSFEGSAFLQGGAILIRGLATGDVYGSVELELTEAIPGSGIYNKAGGLINCNRIGSTVLAKLYLSGEGTRISGQSYPAVNLSLTQTAVQGNMTGDYAGPFNAIFTGLTIDDQANPHNGEGYSLASYSTDKGEAPGWTYANRLASGIITVSGMLDAPLYALIQGVFNSNINPLKFILNTEKLDNSLLALTVKTSQPYGVSPGGTYSFGIVVNNQGTTTFENMSVVAIAPPHMAFVSASSTYTFHSSVYWTNGVYDSVPSLRWDFPQIIPGQSINLSYELKVRIGVAFNGEIMKGQVYILPTQDALDFLPGYDYEGPMDDDVVEDADMPTTGAEYRIIPLSNVTGPGH
ncbi:MAG: hypothetical protein Q7R35_10600, partial [Elusimicrobiota bacterium]|nr:hypothetical protein [Elusimicrobiota bacterium]